jgi:hypothetical protein
VEEEEEEEKEEMSCFHKDHFRLQEGKDELYNFWSLYVDVELYHARLSLWAYFSLNIIDLKLIFRRSHKRIY